MTARDLALHILQARYGRRAQDAGSPELADFQHEAHERLLAAISRYGGALLADSVGLGKTFVAAAVARSLAQPDSQTIAVVPTSLGRLWHGALRDIRRVTVITHATLSRNGGTRAAGGAGLVIVDEAHAFRNPRTRRYAALSRLVAGHPVLLLSATPVNNSAWDLYWLLRLFLNDDSFAGIGVPDLGNCFHEAHHTGRTGRIPALLAEIAVRRSRALLGELHGEVRVGGATLHFPSRAPPCPLSYELPHAAGVLASGRLDELELRPWQDFGGAGGIWLLRLMLLKRLESSGAALRASLERLRRGLQACAEALDRGLLLMPRQRGRLGYDPAQLEMDQLVLRPVPPSVDVDQFRRSIAHDLQLIRHCLAWLDPDPERDPKLGRLRDLLGGELRRRPVLLFSEFRETAEYLWHALRHRVPCALIHGGGAWLGSAPATRRAVIERFAPIANGVPPPSLRETVRVLIATDVLAEGLNLQDAADVVSYDLPWNPIRVVQRLGRIDRLGSPHACVRSWYFVPHRDLEQLLGLLHRIRHKLRAISRTVGPEAPVLAIPPRPDTIRRMAAGDSTPFRDAERRRDGVFEIEERLRVAFRRIVQASDDPLAGLPLAVPAEKPRPLPDSAVDLDPVPYARMLVADGSVPRRARQSARALVVLRLGVAQRAVFVASRHCFEDDLASGEMLLHAIEQGTDPTPIPYLTTELAPAAARHAAQQAIAWLHRPRPRFRGTSAASRLRSRVLRLLQETPGGAGEADCRRVEHLVAALSNPLPVHLETQLGPLAAAARRLSLDSLLNRLEEQLAANGRNSPGSAAKALSGSVGAASPPSGPAAAATVLGVFMWAAGG